MIQPDPIDMGRSLRWLATCLGLGALACLAPTVALLSCEPSTVPLEIAQKHHRGGLADEMRRHQLLLGPEGSLPARIARTPAVTATFADVVPYPALARTQWRPTGPGNDPSRPGSAGEIQLGWPVPVMSVVVLRPPTRGFNALGLLDEIGVGADSGWIDIRGTWEVEALDRILPWANVRSSVAFRRPVVICWANIVAMWMAASLALFTAVQCGRAIRHRRRIAAGACVACGYPNVRAAFCPECGTRLRSALS